MSKKQYDYIFQERQETMTPGFKDYSSGKYRVLSFFAKQAKGKMAAWIIQDRIEDVKALKDLNTDGYQYSGGESTAHKLVFLRKQ